MSRHRMFTVVALVLSVGVVATPAFAQKVVLDYAHHFDFQGVTTYQYVDTPETNVQSGLMDDRIVSEIGKQLAELGLKEVQDGADLIVTYHFATQDNQRFTTTTVGMGRGGWGRGWGRWGAGGMGVTTSSTQVTTFTEGTLVIDAYDPQTDTLVWRGSGTDTIKGKPEAQAKQVEAVLHKLAKRWRKILAGKGK